MNAAHIHLLLNHLPVLGSVFALVLLGYGLVRRSPDVVRASALAFALLGIAGVIVYLTGEPAEEMVEELAGVSEPALEEHEDAALFATALLGVVGGVALAGLLAARRRVDGISRRFAVILFVVALLGTGAMARTAYLGGMIRHEEIRPEGAATAPAAESGEDDD